MDIKSKERLTLQLVGMDGRIIDKYRMTASITTRPLTWRYDGPLQTCVFTAKRATWASHVEIISRTLLKICGPVRLHTFVGGVYLEKGDTVNCEVPRTIITMNQEHATKD